MNNIVKTQLVQRAYDGRWELIGKFKDYDEEYRFVDQDGLEKTLVPDKWITLKVYDYLMEEV